MKLKFKNTEGTEYTVRFKKPDARTWGNHCDGVCKRDINTGRLDVNR